MPTRPETMNYSWLLFLHTIEKVRILHFLTKLNSGFPDFFPFFPDKNLFSPNFQKKYVDQNREFPDQNICLDFHHLCERFYLTTHRIITSSACGAGIKKKIECVCGCRILNFDFWYTYFVWIYHIWMHLFCKNNIQFCSTWVFVWVICSKYKFIQIGCLCHVCLWWAPPSPRWLHQNLKKKK